ncbi:MAG: hypothetical protein HOF93_01155 [Flavobacteriaceae bacterium]|nr:hypothetical protein [Flavobacteriaceae bacterium]
MKIFFLIYILLFFSCANNDVTYIGGKILKKTSNEISILKDENLIRNIPVNDDGIFFSKLDDLEDGLYNFIHLPEFQYLIIENGDSLVLRLNVLDFDESLVFTGKGSSKNNYLIDIFLKHEQEENFIKSKFNSNNSKFLKTVDSLLKIKNNNFIKFKNSNKTNKSTKLILEYAIKLPIYSSVETYISNLKNPLNSNEIYKFRDDVDLNLESLSHFKPYLEYIISRTFNESYQLQKNNTNSSLSYNLNRIDFVNNNIIHPLIKTKILRYIAYEYLLEESKLINIDTFLYKFLQSSNNDETNNEINELYNNIISLQKGKQISKIDLINENGLLKNITKFNNENPVIFVFWSYDQNSHQIGLFNRINKILNNNTNYDFHTININSDNQKWKNIVNNLKKRNNLKHFRSVNFEDMSKKMVLNNLNKVIITDNKGQIDSILNITELENFLK